MTPLNANWRLWKTAAHIGGLLMILVGFLWIFGEPLSVLITPQRGLITEEAIVITREQRGTFQEPAFSITLSYETENADGTISPMYSGQRVDFETYSALAINDVVIIRYDPVAPHEWTLLTTPANDPQQTLIPIVLTLGGLLLFFLPWILKIGSRAEDFEENNGEHLHIS